ncbi:MAG: FAD-dependent oxidoreductase [Oscillospiraceae bacterium]|nr:FAD-dependent oxidoreductase [Oscillospiraceae bacterium]
MQSLWQDDCLIPEREPLRGTRKVDVAIIGAGLAGILTAYFLKERGLSVIVLERGRIGQGETSGTTAKITAQHRLIYDSLIKQYGIEMAKQYALANIRAISQYKNLIDKLGIDCDFKICPAYVFNRVNTTQLENEAEAAARLGIPSFMTDSTELPFRVKGALCFSNQACFHPLKFLKSVAEPLAIYENTRVKTVDNQTVYFDEGRLNAKYVVMATHYPLINAPGYYFMRLHQERSYVQALKNVPLVNGMYVDERQYGLSLRSSGDTLILGGAGHRTGKNPAASNNQPGSYERLRRVAAKLYSNPEYSFAWSAQDCITSDSVPYIGQYSTSTPRMFVATGFNKWGMTSAMVAATLITDQITGVKNDCAPIFSPRRFSVKSVAKNIIGDGVPASIGLLSEAFHFPVKELDDLKKGTGGIIEYKGKKVGAYKAEDGKVHLVSTRCPHLGCELQFNPDEKSWDCPCHGSRFDIYGKWLSSPAVTNLPCQTLK